MAYKLDISRLFWLFIASDLQAMTKVAFLTPKKDCVIKFLMLFNKLLAKVLFLYIYFTRIIRFKHLKFSS